MTGRAQLTLLTATGAAAAGLVIMGLRHGPWPAPWDEIVLTLFVGCLFVGSAVLVGRWRPGTRTSWLLAAAGALILAGLWEWANGPLLFTVGGVVGGAHFAVVWHLVLALPEGRLDDRTNRWLVGSLYILVLLTGVVPNLFFECRNPFGFGCPGNLILVRDDPAMVARTEAVLGPLAVAATVLVAARLGQLWLRSGPPARRVLAPPLAAAMPLVPVVVADVLRLWDRFGSPATLVRPLLLALFPAAVLLGVLRVKARAGDLGGLVTSVGSTAATDVPLGQALALALDDPTARLVPPDDPSLASEPIQARIRTPIAVDGETLAVLEHDPALEAEREVFEAVLAAGRLALLNERLAKNLRGQLTEVQASRARLVAAQDDERRRVERDLHDGAQQRLMSAQLLLRAALDGDGDVRLVEDATAQLAGAVEELRALARGVHPSMVTERGLTAAVEALAERASIPVEVHSDGVPRLASLVETTAYFVVAEALTNVAKHAEASHARVDIEMAAERLLLAVVDDGRGGADPTRGSGLLGLRDRVEAAGGRLEILPRAGSGTIVRAVLPAQTITASDDADAASPEVPA